MLSMHFLLKARNTAWANDRLLRACLDLPSPPEPLLATLAEMQALDADTIGALEAAGSPFAVVTATDVPADPVAMAAAQAALDRRLVRVCAGLDDDRLLSRIAIVHRGRPTKEAVHSVLAHLFTQQAEARGRACAQLAAAGGTVPALDAFFLEADREARADDIARLGLDDAEGMAVDP